MDNYIALCLSLCLLPHQTTGSLLGQQGYFSYNINPQPGFEQCYQVLEALHSINPPVLVRQILLPTVLDGAHRTHPPSQMNVAFLHSVSSHSLHQVSENHGKSCALTSFLTSRHLPVVSCARLPQPESGGPYVRHLEIITDQLWRWVDGNGLLLLQCQHRLISALKLQHQWICSHLSQDRLRDMHFRFRTARRRRLPMSPHAPRAHNETPPSHNETPPSHNETHDNTHALPPPLRLQHIPHHCLSVLMTPCVPQILTKKMPPKTRLFPVLVYYIGYIATCSSPDNRTTKHLRISVRLPYRQTKVH